MSEYLDANRLAWDGLASPHAASPGYRVADFVADPGFVSDVVRFDLPRLGDIAGLRGVHLQCHIGTDTISLSRLGARMTGLDFSGASLAEARRIAALLGAEVDFVQSDVYDAVSALGGPDQFDLVFTGIGALCWLPDIALWGQVVAALLRPGGRLFLREGHPVLWSIDERHTDRLVIDYPYFEPAEPLMDDSDGTYVPTEEPVGRHTSYSWNHGLGEIVMALLDAGLQLTSLVEHDSVHWEALPGQMTRRADGEWQLTDRPWRLPHTYTLQAVNVT